MASGLAHGRSGRISLDGHTAASLVTEPKPICLTCSMGTVSLVIQAYTRIGNEVPKITYRLAQIAFHLALAITDFLFLFFGGCYKLPKAFKMRGERNVVNVTGAGQGVSSCGDTEVN